MQLNGNWNSKLETGIGNWNFTVANEQFSFDVYARVRKTFDLNQKYFARGMV